MRRLALMSFTAVMLYGCADYTPTEPLPGAAFENLRFGAFPGANGKIVFASNRAVGGGILTMQPGVPGVQVLRSTGIFPVWSADGSRIAFVDWDGHDYEIYVMNADGSNVVQVTHNSAYDDAPSWAPDGTAIVYRSDIGGPGQIYRVDVSGTGTPVALTASGANFTPSFSPDGSKIAFTSTRDGNAEIYVMDANGSNQMRLTNNTSPDYDPSWSPDGTRLVFTHQAADHELPDIYVMNANGRGVTNLTNTAAHSEVLAAWSPDGNRVVYVSDGDGNHEIYVRLADGSGTPQNITNDPANDTQPDWQPLPSGAGVADDVRQLMAAVEQLQVAKGMKTSLLAALRDVLAALEAGNSGLACSGLQDFIGKVSAQSGKKIPAASAAALIQAATSIREDLGCETGTLCYPDLPAPQLGLLSTTVDELATIVRFEFVVPNYASFPDQLFMPAPDLAPCGLNTSSSRTWVDIVDGTGNHLFGFCGFGQASDLNGLWLQTTIAQWPAEVSIRLIDRRCNITYTSNRVSLASIL